MGLVDDHRVVVGDHRHALDGVDGQQRVVGDDEVGALGLLARELDEALLAEGALAGAQAVTVADADLAPLAVGVARRGVALARPALLGLLLGPGPQLEHLLAHRALGHLHERALVVGHPLADAVEAGVVGAALEHGVGGVDAGLVLDRLDQAGQVALHELVLQGQGGGGDDHPAVVDQGRHEVAQRLAGAGAGLDEQVLLRLQRARDGLGHLHLTRPLLPAERGHGRRQHPGDRAGVAGARGGRRGGGLAGGGGLRHQRTLTALADSPTGPERHRWRTPVGPGPHRRRTT